MTRTAEQTARTAEADRSNDVGMCLQQCRIWADIGARYQDASTAWHNTNDRHPNDRNPPRGSMVYWTGGSRGFGHIACSLGRGQIRSTDADGAGNVATRTLAWFDQNWPSLRYAGWAWDVNEVAIPHEEEDEMNAEDWKRMRVIVAEEVAANNEFAAKVTWDKAITVTDEDGKDETKPAKVLLRQIWQQIQKKL